ncbi:sulfotransferase [Nocardioides flavus (ex Wang et al. 2016)]|uniref:Sulfotransferase n=1 Tax=Nocardioides flavus (ex Wang et al. 2016) TaxID=2058780 RepID=A0ABQ3HKX8_9ACTN|nr:sulfotransferase [Nocardioides flavus (ex Wang et al. 2016)]GHE18338.1 sulfotransferase [Nocardioides flavus (ex Wang et al. 2016)]
MSGCGHRHLLVVGAQRCGTTYLGRALDAHPDLTMARPTPPEPKVFCDAALSARGADWYHRTWFAHARDEAVLGDKSTSYFEDPAAPGRAAAVLGEVDVVVLLRDPVERAVSHWRFSTANGLETRSLEEALLADLRGDQPWDPRQSSVSPFAYLRRGRYAEQLGPWSTTFPSTTHVLLLEELLADPGVLSSLVAALGLDPDRTPAPAPQAANASPGEAPRLDARVAEAVAGYFQDSNDDLAARLGRSLPW